MPASPPGDPSLEAARPDSRETASGGGGASLRRPFARLSVLNILSNVTVPLAGLVDVALLGHLSEIRHLAGVALASLLFDYIYWTFGFLRMSTTGLTAQATGRGDPREALHVLIRAATIGLVFGLVVVAAQVPLRELGFTLLAGASAVEAAGREYFTARIWAAPVALVNLALGGWFLGRGQSGRLLSIAVVANLSNALLSYWLIAREGLGAAGAGLGSALSQCLALALGLALLRGSTPGLPAGATWVPREIFARDRIRTLFALNRDILIRTVCLVSSFALFTNWSAVMGTTLLAANSILLRLLTLAAYLIDGVAFATETLAGYLLGRHDRLGLRRLRRLALACGWLLAALLVVSWSLWRDPLLALLTSHAEVARLAADNLSWLSLVTLLGASAYVLDGYFLGRTDGAILRRSMLVSLLVFFLPPALWAVERGDNDLLWLSLALFMAARTVTLWRGALQLEANAPVGADSATAR